MCPKAAAVPLQAGLHSHGIIAGQLPVLPRGVFAHGTLSLQPSHRAHLQHRRKRDIKAREFQHTTLCTGGLSVRSALRYKGTFPWLSQWLGRKQLMPGSDAGTCKIRLQTYCNPGVTYPCDLMSKLRTKRILNILWRYSKPSGHNHE